MAANSHVVNHMLTPESRGVYADALANHDHDHDSHFHHDQTVAEEAGSENHLSDCAIYHAYVGMGGLLPVNGNNIAVQRPHVSQSQMPILAVANQSIETQPIRGPPLSS